MYCNTVDSIFLFIILSILFGMLLAYSADSEKKYSNSLLLHALWLVGLAFLVYVASFKLLGNTMDDSLAQVLAPIGIIIASFIASASVIRSIVENRKLKDEENNNKDSEFALNKLIEGLETVYSLLEDRNNNREIWIEASRALLDILELEKSVMNEVHKKILDIKLMEYRHKLYKVIKLENTEKYLEASFFYGVSDWGNKTVNKAYSEAEPTSTSSYRVIEFQNNEHPKLTTMYPKSIKVIFDFIKFPENHTDYLDGIDDLTKEAESKIEAWGKKGFPYREGAANFFKHKRSKDIN